VAETFHHRRGAGIPDREALARHSVEISFAGGGAVERDVADENVLFGDEGGSSRRIDYQFSAGEPLPDVIVRLALQFERDALGEKRAEALPRRAVEAEADGIAGQPRGPVAGSDLARKHGAHGAMHIANPQPDN